MRVLAPVLIALLAISPAAEAKKKKPPKGPTVAVVKSHIAPILDAQHTEGWMTEDQVKVTFGKVIVGKAKKRKAGTGHFDPYIWAWPVKADITITICRDVTPGAACDVKKAGFWTRNVLGGRDLIWFDRNSGFGGWQWATESV